MRYKPSGMSQTSKQRTGNWGERVAATWLQERGYIIMSRNFFARFGEIDIIAKTQKPRMGKTLCFIEVKTRTKDDGSAERATSHTKIQKIKKAATVYCMRKGINRDTTPISFEHVSVYGTPDNFRIKKYILPIG